MSSSLLKSFWLLTFSMLLCCGLYPLMLWSIGQLFFPFQANGSFLKNAAGQPVASLWIAESFTQPHYFHPRPSATHYNAAASGASHLAPSNPALRRRITETITALIREDDTLPIPADAVMTSASGLDPYISEDNAKRQLNRVVHAWAGRSRQNPVDLRAKVLELIQKNTSAPLGGWAGNNIVNVMTLNWMLSQQFADLPHD